MDYSKVTMLEYQEKKKAVLDSVGRIEEMCHGIQCGSCPFYVDSCKVSEISEIENPLEAIKIVMDYEIPVNWSKIKKDTLILVKDSLLGKELPRYFAKYEDGRVYAFANGCTSFTTSDITDWKYARLAENEE